ncbi:MAG: hypothetical protein V4490_07045 [Pseudomonadota bacterium]
MDRLLPPHQPVPAQGPSHRFQEKASEPYFFVDGENNLHLLVSFIFGADGITTDTTCKLYKQSEKFFEECLNKIDLYIRHLTDDVNFLLQERRNTDPNLQLLCDKQVRLNQLKEYRRIFAEILPACDFPTVVREDGTEEKTGFVTGISQLLQDRGTNCSAILMCPRLPDDKASLRNLVFSLQRPRSANQYHDAERIEDLQNFSARLLRGLKLNFREPARGRYEIGFDEQNYNLVLDLFYHRVMARIVPTVGFQKAEPENDGDEPDLTGIQDRFDEIELILLEEVQSLMREARVLDVNGNSLGNMAQPDSDDFPTLALPGNDQVFDGEIDYEVYKDYDTNAELIKAVMSRTRAFGTAPDECESFWDLLQKHYRAAVNAGRQSVFDEIIQVGPRQKVDQYLILVQLFFAEANVYCARNNLFDSPQYPVNFGQILDGDANRHSAAILGLIQEHDGNGVALENALLDYMDANRAGYNSFGHTRALTPADRRTIKENFNKHYRVMRDLKEQDEFLIRDDVRPGAIVNFRGSNSIHCSDFYRAQRRIPPGQELPAFLTAKQQQFARARQQGAETPQRVVVNHVPQTNELMIGPEQIDMVPMPAAPAGLVRMTFSKAEAAALYAAVNQANPAHLNGLNDYGTQANRCARALEHQAHLAEQALQNNVWCHAGKYVVHCTHQQQQALDALKQRLAATMRVETRAVDDDLFEKIEEVFAYRFAPAVPAAAQPRAVAAVAPVIVPAELSPAWTAVNAIADRAEKLEIMLTLLAIPTHECRINGQNVSLTLAQNGWQAVDRDLEPDHQAYLRANPGRARNYQLTPVSEQALYQAVVAVFERNPSVSEKLNRLQNDQSQKLRYALYVLNVPYEYVARDGQNAVIRLSRADVVTLNNHIPPHALAVQRGPEPNAVVRFTPQQNLTGDTALTLNQAFLERMVRAVGVLYGQNSDQYQNLNGNAFAGDDANGVPLKIKESLRLLGVDYQRLTPPGAGAANVYPYYRYAETQLHTSAGNIAKLNTLLAELLPDLARIPAAPYAYAYASEPGYEWIISDAVRTEIIDYKAMFEGNSGPLVVPGARLSAALGGRSIKDLTLDEFVQCLLRTKVPVCNTERLWATQTTSVYYYDTPKPHWTPLEIGILSGITCKVPNVTRYDVGRPGQAMPAQPQINLLYMPPLLLNSVAGASPDRQTVNPQGIIQQVDYTRLLKQRLLPLLMAANEASTPQQRALITLSGVNCLDSAGLTQAEREVSARHMDVAVREILREQGAKLPNIAGVVFDSLGMPAREARPETEMIGGIHFISGTSEQVQPGVALERRGPLAQVDAYNRPGINFQGCRQFIVSEMGATAWPGNSYWTACDRQTREGAIAGGTSLGAIITGSAGQYIQPDGVYRPTYGLDWSASVQGALKLGKLKIVSPDIGIRPASEDESWRLADEEKIRAKEAAEAARREAEAAQRKADEARAAERIRAEAERRARELEQRLTREQAEQQRLARERAEQEAQRRLEEAQEQEQERLHQEEQERLRNEIPTPVQVADSATTASENGHAPDVKRKNLVWLRSIVSPFMFPVVFVVMLFQKRRPEGFLGMTMDWLRSFIGLPLKHSVGGVPNTHPVDVPKGMPGVPSTGTDGKVTPDPDDPRNNTGLDGVQPVKPYRP